MKLEELNKRIKSYTIPKVLFFYGEETFMLENRIEAIKKNIIPKSLESFNLNIAEGKAASINTVIEFIEQFPQGSDRKLVIIKNSGLFANANTKDFKQVKEIVADLPDYVCLIFWESNFDKKRERNLKFIEDFGGGVVNFEYMPINKLEIWVERQFEKADKRIIARDLTYFVRITGSSMAMLNLNCKKLISYLGDDRHKITRADIDAVIEKSTDVRVYDIFNKYVIGGNKKAVHEQIKSLKRDNQSPTMVMSIILDQLYELLMCKLLKQDGMNAQQILNYYDRKPPIFAVNNAIENSMRYSESFLKKSVDKGLKYSMDMKTGKVDQWLAVELFVSELLSG